MTGPRKRVPSRSVGASASGPSDDSLGSTQGETDPAPKLRLRRYAYDASNLEAAAKSLEFALRCLAAFTARVDAGGKEVIVYRGGRPYRIHQVAYEAGSLEDYLASPAEMFTENIEAALRFIREGDATTALVTTSHILSNLVALLDKTARGFKDEDRAKKGGDANKRLRRGRPSLVSEGERKLVLEIAAGNLRRSSLATAAAVLRNLAASGDPDRRKLASLAEHTVANWIRKAFPARFPKPRKSQKKA